MPLEVRRLGLHGLLVDCGDEDTRRRLTRELAARGVPGVVDVVPAALTVGLLLDEAVDPAVVTGEVLARQSLLGGKLLGESLLGADDPGTGEVGDHAPDRSDETVVVPVVYDGEDLAEVGDLLGLSPQQVIAWHTGQVWTCDFTGFMPGFGYLIGQDPRAVPRRATPRPRIPAGAVALAGEWCGVYPGSSPGGWQLIGRTPLAMFDPRRDPVALLRTGMRVRFEALRFEALS